MSMAIEKDSIEFDSYSRLAKKTGTIHGVDHFLRDRHQPRACHPLHSYMPTEINPYVGSTRGFFVLLTFREDPWALSKRYRYQTKHPWYRIHGYKFYHCLCMQGPRKENHPTLPTRYQWSLPCQIHRWYVARILRSIKHHLFPYHIRRGLGRPKIAVGICTILFSREWIVLSVVGLRHQEDGVPSVIREGQMWLLRLTHFRYHPGHLQSFDGIDLELFDIGKPLSCSTI